MVILMAGCSDLLLAMDLNADRHSCGRPDLAGDVPDEGREFARDRHADLVERELARREMPVAARESQLRAPGDLAHCLGLTLLAQFERSADPCGQAIGPGRLDEHA